MTATRQDLTVIGATYHDDLIGPGEVRQLAGDVRITGPISSRTLAVWRNDPDLAFPVPVRELSIGPVWDRRHIAAWLERRYR
jgi:hypothetical protein